FKPEFLNRLDDQVIFNPLDLEAITSIVDILFKSIQSKLAERDITITLTNNAKAYIAEAGFDPVYGARPLKRALYEVVEDRLAELILEDKVVEGSSVSFDVVNEEIVVNIN
ncbi:MAG: ATP-dependent chaperone ClpB, partial [Epsilonproteobacteria bacterium]